MKILKRIALAISVALTLAAVAAAGVLFVFFEYGRDLPDYHQLASYEPPTVTRVHAGDGRLLAEYATEKRVFVPIEAIPKRVINAFLAAEDKNFYSHPGIDFLGVVRAIIKNVANYARNRRPVGASTITQQVAKNFLLTNEVSLERKIKEAILAFRIERAFTKDRILELYLNEIYLGMGSYGVAAAALNYFNKPLDALTIDEAAYLAALPKAPNNYHPRRNYEAAVARRNWAIQRMLEEGMITTAQAREAKARPLGVRARDATEFVAAPYFAEEVRQRLISRFGEKALYGGGLSVRTTVDPRLQAIAEKALRDGLIAYDRRHGWRGPLGRLTSLDDWPTLLAEFDRPARLEDWPLAVVLGIDPGRAVIGVEDGSQGVIPLAELHWARPWRKGQRIGPPVREVRDVLEVGDVVAVEPVAADAEGRPYPPGTYGLRQIPAVNGAIVAMDPHTGRVLAMVGGYVFDTRADQFNRAVQAWRQPGSAIKPFVYLAALQSGFTPSSLILDAPFVIDQGAGLGKWKPANYTRKFYGPSPMRLGIEKSRNLMTVRLAQHIGMKRVAAVATRFGLVDKMPLQLSMALGAGETTLMRLTAGYGMLVNGGRRIRPHLIDRVQDRHGKTVFRNDDRPCEGCSAPRWEGQPVPDLPDARERIADAPSVYQIVSMLQGVVERGTGRRVRAVGKPLAGKTGTTNGNKDAWFIGFSPDLVAGVYVGFDKPKTLGPRETGSSVAAPIFRDFMAAALEGKPAIPFRVPPGIRLVRVNATNGLPARPGDKNVIWEAFKPGTEPREAGPVLDGGERVPRRLISIEAGTGGLY